MRLSVEHLIVPKEGERSSGDAVFVRQFEGGGVFSVIDALGHHLRSAGWIAPPRKAVDVFAHVQSDLEIRSRRLTAAEVRAERTERTYRGGDQRQVVLDRHHHQYTHLQVAAVGTLWPAVGGLAIAGLVPDHRIGDLVRGAGIRKRPADQAFGDLFR